MSYRARSLTVNLVPLGALIVWAAVGFPWMLDTDPATSAPIWRGTIVLAPIAGIVLAGFVYWPTTRRPATLCHLTSHAAADAATTVRHPDGTVTVELRSTKPRRRNGTYFFTHVPHPTVVAYNLDVEPEAVIELQNIDYRSVTVRRRLTGAYRLQGLTKARATIRPYRTGEHDGKLAPMLDPETAPLDELDRQLARLVRQYRTASHLVANGQRPDDIDDATFTWWRHAHRVRWDRRFEEGATPTHAAAVDNLELRKQRLRQPPH